MKAHGLRRVLQCLLRLLGVAWTLPNSLMGLLLGICAIPWGARPRLSRSDFALVFDRWPWGPGGAMTLGNVIINTAADLEALCSTYAHQAGLCQEPRVRIGSHERAHVWQYMLLGPFFLPLYFLLGGISARNPLERAADRYALGQGSWWPWWGNKCWL